MTRAVDRRLLTAQARVCSRAGPYEVCGRRRNGSGFSPVTSHKCCVLSFTLMLLSCGQAGEAWEPANEAMLFRMSGGTEQERAVTYLVFKGLTLILLTWRIWWVSNNASTWQMAFHSAFNPLNAELNPICHLLALLGAHYIFHVSGLRVKGLSDCIINQVITIIIRFNFRNTNL